MNTGQRHSEVSKLFLATCDLAKDEQDAYLDRTCRDDPGMCGEVRMLLDEDTRVEDLLAIRAKRLSEQPRKPGGVDSANLHFAIPTGLPAAAPSIPGYRIDGVLGRGGVGIVYRAREMQLGREVALKVLPAAVIAANPSALERFRREAAAAARLKHENIVPLYEFGESADCYYYTMELIEGDPLSTVIRGLSADLRSEDGGAFDDLTTGRMCESSDDGPIAQHAKYPRLSADEQPFGKAYFKRVARWISTVAEALSYAHECGIVHRDVKPGNLILSHDGRIMITDFGLALTEHEETITRTGAIVGTLRYLSPEQALGNRVPIDHRTDIYSLGATLYELLTLSPLFGRASDNQLLAAVLGQEPLPPKTLNAAVPRDLETICLKALDKRPAARYATAAELASDLNAFLGDEPITARRPSLARRLMTFGMRHKVGVVAGTTTMLLICTTWLLSGQRSKASLDQQVNEHVTRGLVLQQDHRWDEAADAYVAALSIDPNSVRALGNLAIARKEQYNNQVVPDAALLDEADEYLDQALAIAPQNAGLWNVRGVILKMLGAHEEAIEAYRSGLSIEGVSPEKQIAILDNLAEAQWLVGDAESAEQSIRRAAQVAEETGTPAWYAWQDLAALQLAQGNAQATETIERAFSVASRPNWRLHVTRARIRLTFDAVANLASATRDAYAALEEADPDPRVERIMAQVLLRNGDFDASIRHAQTALDLGDITAYNYLIAAIAEAKRGRLAEAESKLEAAREAWPQEIIDAEYMISTQRGMLWFDTADELMALWVEAEAHLEIDP